MKLAPKNWRDFQHYKDRSPPWIRLHRSLLDNYEFQCLPVASKALAPMLWLVACESQDGIFDALGKKLAFRLRMTEKEIETALKPLIDNGFFDVIEDASSVLADSEQGAVPEESRGETETGRASTRDVLPDWIPKEPWEGYVTMRTRIRKPMTQRAKTLVVKELEKLRTQGQEVGAVLDQSTLKNWTDVYPVKGKTAANDSAGSAWQGAK